MIKLTAEVTLYDYNSCNINIDDTTIFLDFKNNYKYTKKLLKKIIKMNKHNIKKIIIKDYDEEVIDVLKAIYIKDEKERINFIYDTICSKLDNKWNKYLPCKFCNNKCIAAQNGYMDQKYDGCCYSFKRKRFGKVKKDKCKYLGNDKKCTTKNISCKLFTCNYLKKNTNFKTNYDDYLLLTLFFNKKQKLILKYNFFKAKEQILNKLTEKSFKPYFLYLFCLDFVIKD